LREGENFFILENVCDNFERYVKKSPSTGSSLHRGPVGEPGGRSFTGTLEGKRKCISRFISLDPEVI
jgi:hypothetical protein